MFVILLQAFKQLRDVGRSGRPSLLQPPAAAAEHFWTGPLTNRDWSNRESQIYFDHLASAHRRSTQTFEMEEHGTLWNVVMIVAAVHVVAFAFWIYK